MHVSVKMSLHVVHSLPYMTYTCRDRRRGNVCVGEESCSPHAIKKSSYFVLQVTKMACRHWNEASRYSLLVVPLEHSSNGSSVYVRMQ